MGIFCLSEIPRILNIPEQLSTDCLPPILVNNPLVTCENSRKIFKHEKKDPKNKISNLKINIIPAFEEETEEKKEISEETKENIEIKKETIDEETLKISETPKKIKKSSKNEEKVKTNSVIEKNQTTEINDSIKYPLELVKSHVKEGNPFACLIDEHATISKNTVIPQKNSFKKIWYYKDPLNDVHGPYSTIEMFNWAAAGYFSTSLKVAMNTPNNFYSLNLFITLEKSKQLKLKI